VISFECDQQTLDSLERAGLDANRVPCLKEGPRLVRQTRLDERLKCGNLYFVNRDGRAAVAYDLQHAGCLQNGETVLRIETAKQVTGKERRLDFFDSVRPSSTALVHGKELLVPLTAQAVRNAEFMSRPNLNGEPGKGPDNGGAL
jgi:hypothetical protein